jgi:hypothetical protein
MSSFSSPCTFLFSSLSFDERSALGCTSSLPWKVSKSGNTKEFARRCLQRYCIYSTQLHRHGLAPSCSVVLTMTQRVNGALLRLDARICISESSLFAKCHNFSSAFSLLSPLHLCAISSVLRVDNLHSLRLHYPLNHAVAFNLSLSLRTNTGICDCAKL